MTKHMIGDVLGFNTALGIAFMQLAKKAENPNNLDVVRVLDGFLPNDELTDDYIVSLVNKKELLFLHFPISRLGSKRVAQLFVYRSNFRVPESCVLPSHFRDRGMSANGEISWSITDGTRLVASNIKSIDDYLGLSPFAMWSLPLLVERLEQGFRLENWR